MICMGPRERAMPIAASLVASAATHAPAPLGWESCGPEDLCMWLLPSPGQRFQESHMLGPTQERTAVPEARVQLARV